MRFYHRFIFVFCLGGALAGSVAAQMPAGNSYGDIANMREDIRVLNQRVGELVMRVEQLERENAALQRKAERGTQAYATVAQLNEGLSEMHRTLKASLATSKDETLRHVATQMERLANQTNAAIESLAKTQGQRPVATPSASPAAAPAATDSYPKEGIPYVVQKGDTLAKIAQKTGAKQHDIIAANRLADPSKIQVGQTLFIPGGRAP